MTRAFIGLGSNIDPEKNMREALRLLAAYVRVTSISTVFEAEPIGPSGQPAFYNCVASVDTELPPLALKRDVLRRIEDRLGRVRSSDKYAPRTIDLDLLLYGDLCVNEAGLELPDPEIGTRPFLARGLSELAPDLLLPGSETAVRDLSGTLNAAGLKPLEAYTALLRGELNHGP